MKMWMRISVVAIALFLAVELFMGAVVFYSGDGFTWGGEVLYGWDAVKAVCGILLPSLTFCAVFEMVLVWFAVDWVIKGK
jgi:hypothetical protein